MSKILHPLPHQTIKSLASYGVEEAITCFPGGLKLKYISLRLDALISGDQLENRLALFPVGHLVGDSSL